MTGSVGAAGSEDGLCGGDFLGGVRDFPGEHERHLLL